ncbi:Uncharacterised protein [Rothia aeria]|uniref:Uncharacterized protein n=2 Tax=Rothia aeria TaxID=172042 RepID=A0A7Z9D6H9_9MICC|nr:Uncharacterised protein [Rothia aeria]
MHGVVFHPINMKNEQNITGSNTLTEDTPAPADNTPGGTKTAKKMTRRVLIGGGAFHTCRTRYAPAGGRHCRTHYLGAGELQREPANDA